jgi:hypothetical protein
MHLEVAPWDRSSSAKAEPGNATSPPGSAWRLERTYIHAADPQARVDDILCQLVYLDGQGHPSSNPVTLYTLSDVNGNVVALADQHGRLAAQYTYEPDGRLRSAEIPAAPATGPPPAPGEWPATIAAARLNRLGFQSLWAERIDVEGATTDTPTAGLDPLGISDATAWPATTNLLGGTPPETHEVLYFARNRFYSPSLNRWTHADPNALGVPVLGTLWYHGGTPQPPSAHFDLTSHYADGLNTHAAFGGNPFANGDPLGLSLISLNGGFMTQAAIRSAAATRATFGAIDGFRFMIAQHLATHYSRYAILTEVGAGAAAGDAIAGNPSVMLYKSVASLGGRNGQEMLEFTAAHFRQNLAKLTANAADMPRLRFYDAHHWIPQAMQREVTDLGVNLHNPLFGVWIERGDHALLHRGPDYLALWTEKIKDLRKAGTRGDAAVEAIAEFIKRDVAPRHGLPVPY